MLLSEQLTSYTLQSGSSSWTCSSLEPPPSFPYPLTGMGILERSFPRQFFMMLQRFTLWWGLGVMDVRRFSMVGFQPIKKLGAGPPGSWREHKRHHQH